MAKTNTQITREQKDDPVLQLQKNLNQNGYSLSEDGILGNETLAAVKDYQSKNGASAEGVNTKQPRSALATKSTGANNANVDNDTGFNYETFDYDDYVKSETVSQAMAALNSQLGAKPGELQSTWEGQVQSALDKILNREEFSYDLNSDALYQQYRDQYTQLGKLASADVMGQAAALTGGYGNSYAATAGNQAYQAYLSQLNEVVPELYGMALDRYNQEGEALYNQYALIADQENQEYSRHQDEYNKWLADTQLAYDRYDTERNFDYNQYATERAFDYGVHSEEQAFEYNDYRNAIADAQWQQQYDESVRQYNESLAEQQRQYNASLAEEQRQYNVSLDENRRQFNNNYNLERQQFNFTKQQYEDAKASGNNDVALAHVNGMTPEEFTDALIKYNEDKDNRGLATFLDDCVASGRLTMAQSDEYYLKYRTDDEEEQVDTSVTPTSTP